MRKIEDMGEYIPGAKKELWAAGKITIDDLSLMSEGDKEKYLTRDILFPAPDYKKMVQEEGVEPWVALFIQKVRALIVKVCPSSNYLVNAEEEYIEGISQLKKALLFVKTEKDVDDLRSCDLGTLAGGRTLIFTKPYYRQNLKLKYDFNKAKLRSEAAKKSFGATKEQKAEKALRDEINCYKIEKNSPDKVYIEEYGRRGSKRLAFVHSGYKYCVYDEKYMDKSLYDEGMCHILYYKKGISAIKVIETSISEEEALAKVTAMVTADTGRAKAEPKKKKKAFQSVCTVNMVRNGYDHVADLNGHLGYKEEPTGQMSLFYDNTPEHHPNEDDFSLTFDFRGIQFGNWESQKDRQENLNWLYNSCKDQATLLNIDDRDISLGGKLGVAFGARGSKGAAAHYEPGYKVINLTKMKGAGCWLHEWGHALDNYIGSFMDCKYMSEKKGKYSFAHDVYTDLMRAIKGNLIEDTEYMKNSRKFDEMYSTAGNGYWSSDVEMFARAFDCYMVDKMKEKGMVNTYLSAHAESFKAMIDGEMVCAFPTGNERKQINDCFDRMFDHLLRKGILHFHEGVFIKAA